MLTRLGATTSVSTPATIVGGRVVWSDGEYAPGYGLEFASGQLLLSAESVAPRAAANSAGVVSAEPR